MKYVIHFDNLNEKRTRVLYNAWQVENLKILKQLSRYYVMAFKHYTYVLIRTSFALMIDVASVEL
mgnify:CR=1 FL=1